MNDDDFGDFPVSLVDGDGLHANAVRSVRFQFSNLANGKNKVNPYFELWKGKEGKEKGDERAKENYPRVL